jgi:hypothetical protein
VNRITLKADIGCRDICKFLEHREALGRYNRVTFLSEHRSYQLYSSNTNPHAHVQKLALLFLCSVSCIYLSSHLYFFNLSLPLSHSQFVSNRKP